MQSLLKKINMYQANKQIGYKCSNKMRGGWIIICIEQSPMGIYVVYETHQTLD
jgi:hypothetical protein